jgi:hypothetical protein
MTEYFCKFCKKFKKEKDYSVDESICLECKEGKNFCENCNNWTTGKFCEKCHICLDCD